MSVGPLGMSGGFAGAAQSRGSETERGQQDDAVQDRKSRFEQKAELAAGVGETAEDQEASDRDGDGRRMWEQPAEVKDSEESPSADEQQPSKDATGDRGANLDLSG